MKVACPIGQCRSIFTDKKKFEEHLWNSHFWTDLALHLYFDLKHIRKKDLAKMITKLENWT